MAGKRVDTVLKIIKKETQIKTENIKPECSYLKSLTQSSSTAPGKNEALQPGRDTSVSQKQQKSIESGMSLQEVNRD